MHKFLYLDRFDSKTYVYLFSFISRKVRLSVCGFCFAFQLVGGLVLGLSIYSLVAGFGAQEMTALLGSDIYQAGAILLIVIGSITILIAFFGGVGAAIENRCMLGFVSIFLYSLSSFRDYFMPKRSQQQHLIVQQVISTTTTSTVTSTKNTTTASTITSTNRTTVTFLMTSALRVIYSHHFFNSNTATPNTATHTDNIISSIHQHSNSH